MKPWRVTVAAVLLTSAGTIATIAAPPANAMQIGNYDVLTNRYDMSSWVWMASVCIPEKSADCMDISAIARRKFYYEYSARAYRADGKWTMVVDVPDGLRCPGQVLPTRDTYTWDDVTLAGEINSVYDVGCFGGPPGTQFWTFALQRL